ncbi:hypothetical protein [Tellurirhabdus bombi]|uniref:hypothetical protein n=1 Tax=Tellurirhabdus bombi TaxID=2907205 RepID=UPI001F27DB35|nr:hypothetical protein [Tellurirhabdus bombi]
MSKFTFSSIVLAVIAFATIAARGVSFSENERATVGDTLIIRTDTLINKYVKDSAYNAVFQRDTTFKVDSAAIRARVDSNLMNLPEVLTGDLNGLAICAGSPVSVPFTTTGRFNPDNQYQLQLVDPAGKITNLTELTKFTPNSPTVLTGYMPSQTPAGSLYSMRVSSSSPVVNGTLQRLRILPPPSAKIGLPDGGAATTIVPGQSATIQVALTGQGPWSFQLSDGTKVVNILQTPYELTVAPDKPTVYKVLSVNSPCGSGTVEGEVIVNVNENPTPTLTLKAPTGGFRVCTGTPFQVAFTATGKFAEGNGFVVQLAGADGTWTAISAAGMGSPLMARLPYGIALDKAYQLRVVASSPSLSSETTTLNVAQQATAYLRSDTIRIAEGKSADLTLDFGGGGPWFVLLSDGTYENGITKTPHTVRVTPQNPTPYSITSAGGACGVGNYSGRTFVHVNVPPSSITTGNLSTRTICHGTEITVPFTTAGRFYASNKYIVQVADTSGKFTNLLTTYKDGVLKATINPAYLKDTLNTVRLRVVSTSPAVAGTETTVKVIAPNVSQAVITGVGTLRPGQTSRVRVAFKNGLPPYSFIVSDGTQINGTFLNPYVLTVAPTTTTEYTVTSLKSACGIGQSLGKAVITVESN